MKGHPLLVGALLFLSPLSVCAEQSTTWDFRKPEAVMPIVDGLTIVEKTPEGLHIRTQQDGFIGWQNPLLPASDVVTLSIKNNHAVEAAFMWQPKNAQAGNLLQLFFTIGESGVFEKTDIMPSRFPEWTNKTPALALGFPAGTDLTIEKIEWRSWSMTDKIANAVQSFWTFDTMSQYSINFLWGPLLATNPESRATLFDTLPPKDMSAMRAVYVILLLAAIVAGVLFLAKKKRYAVMTIFITVSCAWLILDIRMGSELLSYASTDIRTYVLPNTKEFRTLNDVPQMADETEALLKGKTPPTIMLLEPEGKTYVSNIRLRLYPLDVESYAADAVRNRRRAWFVVKRPDITIKNNVVTDSDGKSLSEKGTLLKQFDTDSFLFLEG